MFRIYEILNHKRSPKLKRFPPTKSDLYDDWPEERSMPYFSIVLEQVLNDERYMQLSPIHQGQFWRAIIHVLWRDNGRCIRHAGVISKRLNITIDEWEWLETHLLQSGLLEISPDGNFLVHPDLRAQFIMTLNICLGRSRNASRVP